MMRERSAGSRPVWRVRSRLFAASLAGMAVAITAGWYGLSTAEDPTRKGASAKLAIGNGREFDLGNDMALWVFELQGEAVTHMQITVSLIQGGIANEVAVGTWAGASQRFLAEVYVLVLNDRLFAGPGRYGFTVSASFPPEGTAEWKRGGTVLDPDMVEVGSKWLVEASLIPGQRAKLLQLAYSRRPKSLPPGFGGRHFLSAEEWQRITEEREEVALIAEIVFD